MQDIWPVGDGFSFCNNFPKNEDLEDILNLANDLEEKEFLPCYAEFTRCFSCQTVS